ncbi:MAG: hypothetical protein KC635_16465 [Myxococcales bacterium]|nr:hypothetical protein [Myxococcales bacterium]
MLRSRLSLAGLAMLSLALFLTAQSTASSPDPTPAVGTPRTPLTELARMALVAPDIVRIPIVKEHPSSAPPDAARFSHWSHNQIGCYGCHNTIFPKRKMGFTHADMEQGLFCGSCHNGRLAWSPNDKRVTCETCHVGKSAEIDTDDLFE